MEVRGVAHRRERATFSGEAETHRGHRLAWLPAAAVDLPPREASFPIHRFPELRVRGQTVHRQRIMWYPGVCLDHLEGVR